MRQQNEKVTEKGEGKREKEGESSKESFLALSFSSAGAALVTKWRISKEVSNERIPSLTLKTDLKKD